MTTAADQEFPPYAVLKETLFDYMRMCPTVRTFSANNLYHCIEEDFGVNLHTHTNPFFHALQEIMDEYSVTITYKTIDGSMQTLPSLKQLEVRENNRRRARTE